MTDVVIIGAGPAGLSAAIYAARAELDYVLLEENFVNGGQIILRHHPTRDAALVGHHDGLHPGHVQQAYTTGSARDERHIRRCPYVIMLSRAGNVDDTIAVKKDGPSHSRQSSFRKMRN